MRDLIQLQPGVEQLAAWNMSGEDLQMLGFGFGDLVQMPDWKMPTLMLQLKFRMKHFTPQLKPDQVQRLIKEHGLTQDLLQT